MQNNSLTALLGKAPHHIVQAIKTASHKTGVDFAYLVQQAAAESAFNPSAKAKTSSATGLYQFLERTWLGMVRDHGDKYGLGKYADCIDENCRVTSKAMRQEILDLRKNPEMASLFAAEFANQNKSYLEEHVGGDIGATEMYFAHFLGAGGAAGFLKAMNKDPNAVGAYLFPKESAANRNVFYDSKSGQPRTLKQIYDFFDKKFSASNDVVIKSEPAKEVIPSVTDSKAYSHIPPSTQESVVFINHRNSMASLQNLLNNEREISDFSRDNDMPSFLLSRLRISPLDILKLNN